MNDEMEGMTGVPVRTPVFRGKRAPMQATVRHYGKVAVVDVAGRLVCGDGDVELTEAVQGLLDAGTIRIVLNMEGVAFMDSAGLVGLITCHKRVVERGGALKMLKPTRKTVDLLAIVGLTDIFKVYEDEKEAVDSF